MNDEEEDDLKVTDSKCNTCNHGMCLEDKDVQSFIAPTIVEGNAFTDKPEEPGISETSFPVNKVRSLCFWHPAGSPTMAPIVFSVVSECNRYEKDR